MPRWLRGREEQHSLPQAPSHCSEAAAEGLEQQTALMLEGDRNGLKTREQDITLLLQHQDSPTTLCSVCLMHMLVIGIVQCVSFKNLVKSKRRPCQTQKCNLD